MFSDVLWWLMLSVSPGRFQRRRREAVLQHPGLADPGRGGLGGDHQRGAPREMGVPDRRRRGGSGRLQRLWL